MDKNSHGVITVIIQEVDWNFLLEKNSHIVSFVVFTYIILRIRVPGMTVKTEFG